MEKTNVIVGGSSVNGNIGSCEIKSNTHSINSFYNQTISINSCTGEIMSNNTYFDYGTMFLPFIGLIIIGLFIFAKKYLN